jgi:hypothetical protein
MSSQNSDTQELDKKKAQLNPNSDSTSDNFKNIGSFLTSVITIIFITIGYVIFSSIVLYECKLAQSNILPTILDCYPYTDYPLDIEKINANIFITNTEPPNSYKINFPYDKFNSSNSILDMLRKYKEQPDSNAFFNYFISILEKLINFNNNSLTSFFNFLNNLPEILIVTVGPILSLIYFGLAQIIGFFMFIYYYFSEMTWFFKENVNTDSNSKPKWEDLNMDQPEKLIVAFILVGCFFILFWILSFTITPILVIFIFYMCYFMTFSYKFEFNNKNESLLIIIKETFKNYKVTITTILSFLIVLTAFSNLGVASGVISLLTILLIYFKMININIFESIKPINETPLSTFEQAIKKCSNKVKSKPLFKTLGNFLDLKNVGINDQLKKLNKKLQNKI